jgi:ATP-dependent RNA helicase SUPV3L1/SUV3
VAVEQPVIANSEEAEEPKPVLLWRLGGRTDNQRQARSPGERRGGNNRGQDRGSEHRRQGAANGEGRDGNRQHRGKDGGKPQQGRGDRNEQRGDRQDRGDRKDRNNNRGGPQPLRFEAKPPRKEKPIDPDSPFAKLAALKEQMKK